MSNSRHLTYLQQVLNHLPEDWLKLTTHRLDIYNEALAKTEFTEAFNKLYEEKNYRREVLAELPTAFDYIRLGHPLSCVLEWALAKNTDLDFHRVIAFSSQTMPILAVLRKNHFTDVKTRICYNNHLPEAFEVETVKRVYGYQFEIEQVKNNNHISPFEGSTIFVSEGSDFNQVELHKSVDFHVYLQPQLGSVIFVNNDNDQAYTSEIQHVRRRESIAMTPDNCYSALKMMVDTSYTRPSYTANKEQVLSLISDITGTQTPALIASSGLSIQYAIMMGLIEHALDHYPGKGIRFVVPPNCYGGTNDQARRVAACMDGVEVVDLPVDGDNNMVDSVARVLDSIAREDAVPYIIAEIPTNPRVEVPDLLALKKALNKKRQTGDGQTAIEPLFILDQTFCPNVPFYAENELLSSIKGISYVSGSKFPSGGKCTAGYCVANHHAASTMSYIDKHLSLCDNAATDLQVQILSEQMPSMNQRIADAYANTLAFVDYIKAVLPSAKINFVSGELAKQGFTPSVFSLDLPTKGDTHTARETHKRMLNQRLIDMMIAEIPNESKYCVSYGQLKGCYWTIPATSTQGTTKEEDKDYIARVSVSPNLNLDKHKEVFKAFVESMETY